MIHAYRFKNFFSFREEHEVSFAVPGKARNTDFMAITKPEARLSKVMAVMGPNASGKTNVIKPLVFLHWFVGKSFHSKPDEDIPLKPHFFNVDAPSEFEIELDFDGKLWKYQLTATKKRVLREALYRKDSRAYSYVFRREWDKDAYRITQRGFGFAPAEAKKVRQNASLISTAAQYGVEIATQLAHLSLASNVYYFGRADFNRRFVGASEYFFDHEKDTAQMSKLIRQWDMGIKDIVVRELDSTDVDGKHKKIKVPFCTHTYGSKSILMELHHESSGTQGIFVLLAYLLPVLRDGGVAVIDELEADLHPHMLVPILELFSNESTNRHNAQIIFTCHAAEVLMELHKCQVLLVEKNDKLESEVWRLDSMEGVRPDENLYAKYMAGAYSAVPEV